MNGLLPVVVQNARTGEVLMLGYMNQEAHDKTTETGLLHLWSRARRSLWLKGEISGHLHEVVGLVLDCDGDALLVEVLPKGPTCHTGERTCFHNVVKGSGFEVSGLRELEDTIRDRLT
ncbi:MAG: phosphoribosyl-AMP cyclohydrolase, partial [candidate division WOR-3 bacterium]